MSDALRPLCGAPSRSVSRYGAAWFRTRDPERNRVAYAAPGGGGRRRRLRPGVRARALHPRAVGAPRRDRPGPRRAPGGRRGRRRRPGGRRHPLTSAASRLTVPTPRDQGVPTTGQGPGAWHRLWGSAPRKVPSPHRRDRGPGPKAAHLGLSTGLPGRGAYRGAGRPRSGFRPRQDPPWGPRREPTVAGGHTHLPRARARERLSTSQSDRFALTYRQQCRCGAGYARRH